MESEVELLVAAAKRGNEKAIEELVLRIQDKVYRLALRMLYDPYDAQDSSQEILFKIINRLETFKGESSFYTWVYRVAANYLLTVRKRRAENDACSFEQYQEALDRDSAAGWQEPSSDAFQRLFVEEIRISCLQGLLLCLDRGHRLAYLLADVFDVTGEQGAAILDVSPQVFRKRLSRARKRIRDFLIRNCSVVNPAGPCKCEHFLPSYVDGESLDENRLMFANHPCRSAEEENPFQYMEELDELKRIAFLYKRYPNFHSPEALIENIRGLLRSRNFGLF